MKSIGVAIFFGALGAFAAFLLIDILRVHPLKPLGIMIRCVTLTPCALWIDWHLRRPPFVISVPLFSISIISIVLWGTSAVVAMLSTLLPFGGQVGECPEVALVRESVCALVLVGVPGTVIPIITRISD